MRSPRPPGDRPSPDDGGVRQVTTVAERACRDFNTTAPIGTPVHYWPGARIGDGKPGEVRSTAWVLPSGEPVVMVTGYAGGIHLDYVEVSA